MQIFELGKHHTLLSPWLRYNLSAFRGYLECSRGQRIDSGLSNCVPRTMLANNFGSWSTIHLNLQNKIHSSLHIWRRYYDTINKRTFWSAWFSVLNFVGDIKQVAARFDSQWFHLIILILKKCNYIYLIRVFHWYKTPTKHNASIDCSSV